MAISLLPVIAVLAALALVFLASMVYICLFRNASGRARRFGKKTVTASTSSSDRQGVGTSGVVIDSIALWAAAEPRISPPGPGDVQLVPNTLDAAHHSSRLQIPLVNPFISQESSPSASPILDSPLDPELVRTPSLAVTVAPAIGRPPLPSLDAEDAKRIEHEEQSSAAMMDASPGRNQGRHAAARTAVRVSDDSMSLKTTSTLPPSYHTRRSHDTHHNHPTPVDIPRRPMPPPPASRSNRTSTRRSSALTMSSALRNPSDDVPEDHEMPNRAFEIVEERRTGGQRRSRDGGVRLDGGPLDMQDRTRVGQGDARSQAGSTRPPSYLTD